MNFNNTLQTLEGLVNANISIFPVAVTDALLPSFQSTVVVDAS